MPLPKHAPSWWRAWFDRWVQRQEARLTRLGWDHLNGLPRGY